MDDVSSGVLSLSDSVLCLRNLHNKYIRKPNDINNDTKPLGGR